MAKEVQTKVGQVINDRYKVIKLIGEGAFGEIYCAEEVNGGTKFAVKFESLDRSFLQLPIEHRVYQSIGNAVGFAQCVFYQQSSTESVIVMSLLGQNLKELFQMCNRTFSLKTVLRIAIQSISRLEVLHGKNFIYRDIKPDNFVLGQSGTQGEKTIHLVDFGMAKEYIDRVTQRHIRLRSNRPMLGTARFMSCNAHFNYELSRRDDLESLGYMFLYFLKGSVPWSALLQSSLSESTPMKQLQKIGSMKQALSPEDIFENCPEEFARYLSYCRNLGFEETPAYEACRSSFHDLFTRLGFKDDGLFDWDTFTGKIGN
ncbi:Casein kinase I isoform gamma-2 [Tyrophagus putrescentiae]|nr:Casein kinase I isoform gamma-2 [Tyrophagus putrescentiae]